jgi:hypothetical protein
LAGRRSGADVRNFNASFFEVVEEVGNELMEALFGRPLRLLCSFMFN